MLCRSYLDLETDVTTGQFWVRYTSLYWVYIVYTWNDPHPHLFRAGRSSFQIYEGQMDNNSHSMSRMNWVDHNTLSVNTPCHVPISGHRMMCCCLWLVTIRCILWWHNALCQLILDTKTLLAALSQVHLKCHVHFRSDSSLTDPTQCL